MQLNPVMEEFYLSILKYAGLKYENDKVENINPKFGDFTVADKPIALPYFDTLKNPNGKLIFHPLNENYTMPETSLFNLYRERLLVELNLRLSSLVVSLIAVASDIQLQQRVKSQELLELISSIGEADISMSEAFLHMVKASKKARNTGFIFDVFLKKNGEVNGTPYGAIGKVNFVLYNEIVKSIEDKTMEYKVFGTKVRKKDLLVIKNIFNTIFPEIDTPEKYTEGTDNKIFRYLNILLKVTYPISRRMNSIANMLEELKDASLHVEDIQSDLVWANTLEKLYSMATEIRLIPNQTNTSVEGARLHVDESKAKQSPPQTQQIQTPQPTVNTNPPMFNPNSVPSVQQQQQPQQLQQPVQVQQPQQQPPRQLTAEEIIRGNLMGGIQPQQPMTPMQYPMMTGQIPMQQQPMPTWMQMELMKSGQMPTQQQPQVPMNLVQQQPAMMGQMPIQQPMYPQQMQMMGQMPIQQPMYPQQIQMMGQMPMQQQGGLEVNPMFLSGNSASPFR